MNFDIPALALTSSSNDHSSDWSTDSESGSESEESSEAVNVSSVTNATGESSETWVFSLPKKIIGDADISETKETETNTIPEATNTNEEGSGCIIL